MFSRKEFEDIRRLAAYKMSKDHELHKSALNIKVKAGHEYYWVHQTNWMGEPCLQLATDMFGIQEAIFKSRPDYIVECGVAWGGTLLFCASLLKLFDGIRAIGIDIYIPDDLKYRLNNSALPVTDMIELIEGSSTNSQIQQRVFELIGKSRKVMVILDSLHTHDHVLQELQLFAPLVGIGQYLICGDTIIEKQPPAKLRPRPWGKGNSPATALKVYLDKHPYFEIDHEIENKLLFSNMPGGYLRRIKDSI